MKNKQWYILIALWAVTLPLICLLCCGGANPQAAAERIVADNSDKLCAVAEEALALELSGSVSSLLSADSRNLVNKLNIEHVCVVEEKVCFIIRTTGLMDGGVEYGFYYSPMHDSNLDLCVSSNDWMKTSRIEPCWYYYEWHNG